MCVLPWTFHNSHVIVGIDPFLLNRQYRPDATREAVFQDDIRRVRLQQQQQANIRAVEAAKEHKEKETKEKTRKNQLFDPKKQGGTKLGRTSDNDYSPMQPWSGSTKGYKPTRRIVNRG